MEIARPILIAASTFGSTAGMELKLCEPLAYIHRQRITNFWLYWTLLPNGRVARPKPAFKNEESRGQNASFGRSDLALAPPPEWN
jgi:hypothetical protein